MPNLPLWVYCCCGGNPTNCCDWWSCPVATPTTVRVEYLYEKVRYYSNGQRLVMEREKWSVANRNALTRKGINCLDPLGYDDGCTQARFEYEAAVYYYNWTVLNDATLDGYTGTISGGGQPCTGCIFRGPGTTPLCVGVPTACLYREDLTSGAVNLTGGTVSPLNCVFGRSDGDIIKYGCTNACDGCVAPFVQFRPTQTTFTGSTLTNFGCCTSDPPVPESPITIVIPRFTLVGRCGCPDINSWAKPKNGCSCPDTNDPFTACIGATCNCLGVNNYTTLTTGQDCWSWTCANYAPDPFNPIITACNTCLDYIERCEKTVTVTVI